MSDDESTGFGTLISGVLLIGVAIGGYYFLTHFEEHGGRFRAPIILIFIYNMLGKWGFVGLLSLLGGFMVYSGAKDMYYGD